MHFWENPKSVCAWWYQERGCECREHRGCGLPGPFGDPEAWQIGNAPWWWWWWWWWSGNRDRSWRASSGGISGTEKPPEHHLLCIPSSTSTTRRMSACLQTPEMLVEIAEIWMLETSATVAWEMNTAILLQWIKKCSEISYKPMSHNREAIRTYATLSADL
jgi:hypothetical protein